MCSDPWHSSPAQPVQPVQPVQDTERAAFEKWWDTSQPDEDSIANFAWRGWQARAERAAERLKRLSFEITGNDYALTEQSPEEVSASLQAYRENVLADRSGPQPIPEHAKLPIDRPCSACSDGDTEMKYHDHTPPFRAQPVPEVKPPNSD